MAQGKLTPEVIEQVLARMAKGEPLTVIGRDIGFVPMSWYDLMERQPHLRIAHQRARDAGADAIAEECLEIADQVNGEAIIAYDAYGKPYAKIDGESLQRSKLKIDTRLKLLAKWNPKRYGERLVHAGDEAAPLAVQHSLSPERVIELARKLREKSGVGELEHIPEAEVIEDGSDLV